MGKGKADSSDSSEDHTREAKRRRLRWVERKVFFKIWGPCDWIKKV